MNTGLTLAIDSTGSVATEKLGERLGQKLKGGEVIELISDLGGGKTTFIRGLARGAGSQDHVSSPTFTISRQYHVRGRSFHMLYHFDFYRLPDAGLMVHELKDALNDSNKVVVIEWGYVVAHILPGKRLTIKITKTDNDSRLFEFSYPKEVSYLLEGIKSK